jgi:hypothetical protein
LCSIDFASARGRIAAAVAATLIAAGAQANVLIVRATGPSANAYPAGKMLSDTTKIVLKPNDAVVLLDEHGTRTLRGPGNFSAIASAAAEQQGATAFASLEQRTDKRVRIGAVRGVNGTQARSPNIWYVDAGQTGATCIADPAKAMIWRPGSDVAATTVITGAGGTSATLSWGVGQAVQAWPATLPLTEGAKYDINTGTGVPGTITIALIGTPAADPQQIGQTLIQHGCKAQLDLLLTTVNATQTANGN